MLKKSFSLLKWDILHSRRDQSVNQEDMLVDTAVMVMTQVDMAMMMEDIMTKVTAMGLMIAMAPMIAMDTVAMVVEAGVAATVAVKRVNSYSVIYIPYTILSMFLGLFRNYPPVTGSWIGGGCSGWWILLWSQFQWSKLPSRSSCYY